jgi:hypothetical protein
MWTEGVDGCASVKKLSAARYRELLKAEQESDALLNALGCAWLELHDWLTLAAPPQQQGSFSGDAPGDGAHRKALDLEHTLAMITDVFVDRIRSRI